MQAVLRELQARLGPSYDVQQHPVIGTALMVRGTAHCHYIDYSLCGEWLLYVCL